jgi:protein required for attachment to host cells
MQTIWIIAANAGRARFFSESDPAEPLQEVADMVNPAVRLRTQETESDKIGPTAAPNKAYQPAHTPAEKEAEQFAKDISHYLMKAHEGGRFQQLVISASPHFLGALRLFLDPHIKQLIKLEVNKDYTHFNAHQLREQLHAQQAKSE